MAILKKIDYLIKETSSGEIGAQLNSVISDLNAKQILETNKLGGDYKTYYYGSVFDPRSKKEYFAFADITKTKFALANSTYEASAAGSGSVSGSGVDENRVNELIGLYMTNHPVNVLNDATQSKTTTYSSSKIEELLSGAVKKDEYEKDFAKVETMIGW